MSQQRENCQDLAFLYEKRERLVKESGDLAHHTEALNFMNRKGENEVC